MSFTWQAGRQMKTAKTSDGVTYTFKYDQDGNRLSKTASSGTTTNYILNGGALVGETRTTGTTTQKIAYILDENGTKIGLTVNGVTYYYLFNAQGDVMALTNAVGDIVAEYVYDAWGKVVSVLNEYGTAQTTATFIGNVNPIRYRGYYYDTETKLYYLQSRYYDPETCRFVNMDDIVPKISDKSQDYNLYAYCNDDPVSNSDSTGHDDETNEILQNIRHFAIYGTCKKYSALIAAEFKRNGIPYGNGYSQLGGCDGEILNAVYQKLHPKEKYSAQTISTNSRVAQSSSVPTITDAINDVIGKIQDGLHSSKGAKAHFFQIEPPDGYDGGPDITIPDDDETFGFGEDVGEITNLYIHIF